MCPSRNGTLQTLVDRSRCRLACGLGWALVTIYWMGGSGFHQGNGHARACPRSVYATTRCSVFGCIVRVLTIQPWARRRRPKFIADCPRLSDLIDFISVKRGRPLTVINSCSRRISLSQLVASDRQRPTQRCLLHLPPTSGEGRGVAIALICGFVSFFGPLCTYIW